MLQEAAKEAIKPEPLDLGPMYQVPNPGGEELPPPPEPNPQIRDAFSMGGKLFIPLVAVQACRDGYPIAKLHP
jgi:hypothetical protein